MDKEVKLVKKIKHLLKRAGIPRYLHRYGPKKYAFVTHALALFIRQAGKLSYRRASKLLRELGFMVPTYSALCKMNKRAASILVRLFEQTSSFSSVVVASLDATTIARSNPSWHYIKRIDRKKPVARPLKLSMAVDTRRKKIIALRLRAKPRHDTKDVQYLLQRMPQPKILVADKGYDAEYVHEYCFKQGITTMIPSKKTTKKGFYRKKQRKRWRLRTYHRREISEALFSATKQRYGSSVSSRSIRTQRSDIYCRAILQNLSLAKPEIFNSAHLKQKLLKPL